MTSPDRLLMEAADIAERGARAAQYAEIQTARLDPYTIAGWQRIVDELTYAAQPLTPLPRMPGRDFWIATAIFDVLAVAGVVVGCLVLADPARPVTLATLTAVSVIVATVIAYPIERWLSRRAARQSATDQTPWRSAAAISEIQKKVASAQAGLAGNHDDRAREVGRRIEATLIQIGWMVRRIPRDS